MGTIKDGCTYGGEETIVNFHTFSAIDGGESLVEYCRLAEGQVLDGTPPERLAGMSGGLIWNQTRQHVEGIILRGGIQGFHYIFHYMPFELIRAMISKWDKRLSEHGIW